MQSEWRVHSCSSETDVHEALNVLKEELYKIWQTSDPPEEEAGGGGAEGEAWIILEPHPPSAFSHIEIVNAGSALVEVYGIREPEQEINSGDRPRDDNDMDFEMLLSAQQLMSVKDVVNKANRNRLFVFSTSDKLSPLAAQHRWRRIRVSCHQPFGSREHKVHIGLSRVSFKCCQTSAEISAEAAEADLQKGLKNNLKKMFPESMSCDGDIVSKVTEPSKLVSSPKAAKLIDGSSKNSGSKRRMPNWESPKNKLKTNNRDKEVESGEYNDKANTGDEAENYKVKDSEKNTSASKRFKGEELVTQTRRISGHVNSDNHKCDAVSVSAEMKGSPTGRKEIPQPSKQSKSYKQHQSPKDREIDEEFSKTQSTRKQKEKRLLENTGKDLKADAGEKKPPFHKFLNGVVFALSGLVNPERANIREIALQMGAQYRPDWTSDCTLLVCAFANTPKFNQVKNNNGTIVSKDWILDCYEQKELLDIDQYLMHAGKPWRKLDMFVYNAKDSTSGQKISPSSRRSEPRLTIASLPEIEQWVCTDVASSIEWLQKQENHPKPEEVKSIAIQGIELCLEDTIKCLKNKESIGKILETWDFVPRAVRELSHREKTTNDARDVSNFQDLLSEAERMKWIYALELKKLEGEGGNNLLNVNEDDDSTDKISAKSSSDTESDDETEILGEEDITKAKEKIKKMLAEKAT